MSRNKFKADRRLHQGIDESLVDPRPNGLASQVFRRLRAHHAARSATPAPKPNALNTKLKAKALLALAKKRKMARLDGYSCVGEFHGGNFECNHVSPWTKSGHNVDAKVMVVGQDWSSRDVLASEPPNRRVARLGLDQTFPTNANLDDLLQRHFGLSRGACYLTNLFALVKGGRASAQIPLRHLVWSAQDFTLDEIRIVSPRLVLCLGLRTFRALMRATGRSDSLNLDQAIKSPFKLTNATIHCVAHTGALGRNSRGQRQVEKDWQKLAELYAGARHRQRCGL